MRFDASGAVSCGMFAEDWPRYVVKMAAGAGKTKVLSLLMAWRYFHRLYESGPTLSRNFLLAAPNIIVLDRLRADFDGLRIFFANPVLSDNGHAGQNWRDDFQLTVHLQDGVRIGREFGNLFLTNIHRVYLGEVPEPSTDDDNLTDYFLQPFGAPPSGKNTDSKTDPGELIRDIDELAIFNDEAHHITTREWPAETRNIVFKTMLDGDTHHTLALDGPGAGDGRSVVAFLARQLLKDLRLVGGYEQIHGQVKSFVRERLFAGPSVELDDPQVLRNLSENVAIERVFSSFKSAINALTLQDSGNVQIEGFIHLRDLRPLRTQHREWLPAERCIFNRTVGEPGAGGLALRFARFLDQAEGVVAFAKTTWPSASSSVTSRPTASCLPTCLTFLPKPATARCGSSKPRAAKNSTCPARWPGWRNGVLTPLRPVPRKPARPTGLPMSIKPVSTSTRPTFTRIRNLPWPHL